MTWQRVRKRICNTRKINWNENAEVLILSNFQMDLVSKFSCYCFCTS